MKVKRIEIKNFKGFEFKEIEFNPGFTVLIGKNGSGKSSILDALSFALGTYFLGVDGQTAPSLQQSHKRRSYVSPNSLEVQLPLKIHVDVTLNEMPISWWRETNKKNGGSTSYKSARELINMAKRNTKLVREGETVDLPLLAYYGTERLSSERHERKPYLKKSSRLDGYTGAFDPRSVKRKFLNWFKTIESTKLQQFQEEKEVDDALYEAFVQAINKMVPEWSKVHFNLKNDDMMGQLKNGTWMQFGMLSDGYQNIVRLVADIAFRAIKLNPHFGQDAVINTKGIVLIDELDMHLHPSWQKNVVLDLKNAFPNIQFITTTHSPFIVQSLESNEIVNLDSNKISDAPNKLSLEENSLFMGVEGAFSNQFLEKERLSIDFLTLLNEDKSEELLKKLNYLIDRVTDPVMKAKLQLEKLSKFGIDETSK
jgi:predicted ATP-binding protein involved in virulence